jgi:hypothetical protein
MLFNICFQKKRKEIQLEILKLKLIIGSFSIKSFPFTVAHTNVLINPFLNRMNLKFFK